VESVPLRLDRMNQCELNLGNKWDPMHEADVFNVLQNRLFICFFLTCLICVIDYIQYILIIVICMKQYHLPWFKKMLRNCQNNSAQCKMHMTLLFKGRLYTYYISPLSCFTSKTTQQISVKFCIWEPTLQVVRKT
jgi:hypothetical protein